MNVAAFDIAELPLALAWEQPWLLLWGAAAALPLLIHLLSRRRYQTTPWAAMEFLLAAARKQSRRVRLENWLLLVLRTMIILLFVVILAGPYEESPQTIAPDDQRVHTIYVLDGSFSMGQTSGGSTLFQLAKDAILREFESDGRRDDAFSLVLMTAPARAIVKTPSTDRRSLADAVTQLELPHGRADLPGALALVREMTAVAPRAWPPLVRQEIIFLTDLGRNTWALGEGTTQRAEHLLARQLVELAEAADVRIIELGTRGATNLAISQIALGESLALAGSEASVAVSVRNFSDAPRGEVNVELLVDGRRIEERTIPAIAARGEATATFAYRFAGAGTQTLEARLSKPGDALDVDDSRWLVTEVRERFRTLCVGGGPDSAEFVAAAAAPARTSAATFEAQVASPGLLRSGLNLDDFDVVALCNVPPLGTEEVERLGAFARRGGGLVWFLGDLAEPSAFNALVAGDRAGLLPARLVQPSPWGAYTIDPLDFAHPILEPFRGQQDTTLARTPIQRYVQLSVPEGSASEVVLRVAETGDPLVVAGRYGAGRVAVFATDGSLASVDPTTKEPWTYWPVWQSFLPVVQETLRFVAAGRDERLNALVGTPIGGPLSNAASEPRIVVRVPNANHESLLATVVDRDGQRRWEFGDTAWSGVYEIDAAATSAAETNATRIAVNVDPAESDLARAASDGLPEGMVATLESLAAPTEEEIVTQARRDWHVPLLCGLLGLVGLESLCAWLLGRRMA
ncbi:MAG: hypothetical protein DCC68_21175 [Planctomycetota bacterium]|nr:MAG: hypothetical protein DCC68_21175 [Planctomycetota bacterium]